MFLERKQHLSDHLKWRIILGCMICTEMYGNGVKILSSSISAILAQRLGRKLCPHCKEAYKPNPEFLKQAGLSSEKVKELFRAKENKGSDRCTHCSGLGYMGRIGVFELLVVNDRMREMIRETEAMSAIKAEARKAGMLTMMEEGVRLVVRGVTSVEEIVRVVK